MRSCEPQSGLIVATGCQRPIKAPGMDNDLERSPPEAPKCAMGTGCVFPGRQYAAVGAGAGGDRQAAFGALPCCGQAVERITATLAQHGSFVRHDYAIAAHRDM